MTSNQPIPFFVVLKRLANEAALRHEVILNGHRRADPARVVVTSRRYRNPQIHRRISKGGIDLTDSQMDALFLMCFNYVAKHVLLYMGIGGCWETEDLTPLIQAHFDTDEARPCDTGATGIGEKFRRIIKDLAWGFSKIKRGRG